MIQETYTIFLDLWMLAYQYMLYAMDINYEAELRTILSKQIIVERNLDQPIEVRSFDIKYRCRIAECLRVDVGFRNKRDPFKLRLKEINFEKAPIIFEEHFGVTTSQNTEPMQQCETLSEKSVSDWRSKAQSNADRENIHLVIFVHGYLASSYDMAFLKCQLQRLVGEDVSLVCSRANDADSSTSIMELGKRLAIDVQETIAEYGSVKKYA